MSGAQSRAPLARLFEPESIAVVGASATPGKAGYMLMQALSGFPGAVFPVNPNASEIQGRAAVPDLAAIEGPVDLVIMGVPAAACPDVLREAAAKGAAAALIVSGGFGEVDEAGQAVQAELAAIRTETGIRLMGPNTSGFLNPAIGLVASFLPAAGAIGRGPVAIVAQSGGVNLSLAFDAHAEGLGVGLAAGLGNAVDVGIADVVEYLSGREDIRAIALHLEGVPDGRRLFEVLGQTVKRKPVAALPVGRSDIGAFARSHTGNLMGSHALTVAALRQAGAVVVETTAELIDAVHALSAARLDPKPDPGVALVTGQAGPGLIAADLLRNRKVSLPALSPETEAEIGGLLPPLTYMKNPVDTGRPAKTFGAVAAAAGRDSSVDVVLAYALQEEGALDGPAAMKTALSAGKPVLFGTGGEPAAVATLRASVEALGVPSYGAPDRAATGVWAMVEDARLSHRARAPRTGGRDIAFEPAVLDEAGAKDIVDRIGLATPARRVCNGREAAQDAFHALEKPVVAKLLRADVHHKSDIGGIRIGIDSPAALDAALDALDAAGAEGRYLIEETAPDGVDLILGARRDGSYGPAVLLGLGGTAAEALGDVQMCLAPLSEADAHWLLDRLAARRLLDGWRGAPPVDRDALAKALIVLGDLICANAWIAEIDLNPVRAFADGAVVLDALILGGG